MKLKVNKWYLDHDIKLNITIHLCNENAEDLTADVLDINVTDGLNSCSYDADGLKLADIIKDFAL